MTKNFQGHALFTIYDKCTNEYLCFDCTAKYAAFLCDATPQGLYALLTKEKSPYIITRTYTSLPVYRKKIKKDLERIELIKKGALPV